MKFDYGFYVRKARVKWSRVESTVQSYFPPSRQRDGQARLRRLNRMCGWLARRC